MYTYLGHVQVEQDVSIYISSHHSSLCQYRHSVQLYDRHTTLIKTTEYVKIIFWFVFLFLFPQLINDTSTICYQ